MTLLGALLAALNQRYVRAPEALSIAQFAARDEAWLKWRFLGNMLAAIERNRRKLERKART